jgi:hypothetical protein
MLSEIFNDRSLIFAKGYGFANLEYNIPITPINAGILNL